MVGGGVGCIIVVDTVAGREGNSRSGMNAKFSRCPGWTDAVLRKSMDVPFDSVPVCSRLLILLWVFKHVRVHGRGWH